MFSRRYEQIAQIAVDPASFELAASLESISESEKEDYSRLAVPVHKELAGSSNLDVRDFRVDLMDYPIPANVFDRDRWLAPKAMPHVAGWENNTGKRTKSDSLGLFDTPDTLYVAVELQYRPSIGLMTLVNQQIVTFSTALNGLSTALASHFRHRLDTREELTSYGSEEELRDNIKYLVFAIDFPTGELALDKTVDGFTWSSDKYSLLQLRQIVSHIERALTIEAIRLKGKRWEASRGEKNETIEAVMVALSAPYGTVTRGGIWTLPPTKDVEETIADEEDGRPIACTICSK